MMIVAVMMLVFMFVFALATIVACLWLGAWRRRRCGLRTTAGGHGSTCRSAQRTADDGSILTAYTRTHGSSDTTAERTAQHRARIDRVGCAARRHRRQQYKTRNLHAVLLLR